MKKFIKNNYLFITIVVLLSLFFYLKLPYYIMAPGGTININDRVELDNYKVEEGSINMLYVSEYKATPSLYLYSLIMGYDIKKNEEKKISNESEKEVEKRNKIMRDNSLDMALMVAYTKANKYRQIYDAFLNFGSILKAETLKEISEANLFPDSESLLLLERKYADILNDEDISGIHKEKKKKKRIKLDALTKTSTSGFSGHSSIKKTKRSDSLNESLGGQSLEDKDKDKSAKKKEEDEKNAQAQLNEGTSHENEPKKGASRLDSKNLTFDAFIKERTMKRTTSEDIWNRQKNYLRTMNRKPREDRFCRPSPTPMAGGSNKFIMYGFSRANHYEDIVKTMREKYIKDKDHFYTYSLYGLSFNFPLFERDRNEEYYKYIDNKSKWLIQNKDFDRYKQPPKEKYYFPKINNIL